MKNCLTSRLFWLGLALRFILIPFFGSVYLRELFIPFLDSAIHHSWENPWTLMPPAHFPYGIVLFVLLYLPRLLAYEILGEMALGDGWIGISLVKLPILSLEILSLLVLLRFAKGRTSLFYYYWLNPMAIYITYIHGQLEVAVMTFYLISLYALVSQKTKLSAVSMAAATLCKFHAVINIPLILAYLWNRQFAKQAGKDIFAWLTIWCGLAAMGFVPLIAARNFLYASTSSPEAMRIFSAQIDLGSGQVIYIGVVLVLVVLGRLCISTRMSDQGLVLGSGLVFGALLLTTDTMPGWYYWVLPFLSLFFALYLNVPRSLYWMLNGLYLIYFSVFHDRLIPFPIEQMGNLPRGIGLTLLQTALGGVLISMWALAVKHEAVIQGRSKPLMLGIAGDSGSGKNYLSQVLTDLFAASSTSVVVGDDYHRWERLDKNWENYTPLNPKANSLETMASHAALLSKGRPILQQEYDHSSGSFSLPKETKPSKTIIVQGLHTFYLKSLRGFLDFRIFLAPDPMVRLSRKLKRDSKERGYPVESILESMETREKDSQNHVAPQIRYADWIIEHLPSTPLTREEIIEGKDQEFYVRFTMPNNEYLVALITELEKISACRIRVESDRENCDRVVLAFSGDIAREEISRIADRVFKNIRHITRAWNPPRWRSGLDGITQLFALSLLRERMGASPA